MQKKAKRFSGENRVNKSTVSDCLSRKTSARWVGSAINTSMCLNTPYLGFSKMNGGLSIMGDGVEAT
jgi:hypothetical protein